MAERQKQQQQVGAPAWMVTFGDMMSLLLCFFVILVALAEVKEEKFQVLVNSFRRYFGYETSSGHVDATKYNDVFQRLSALRAKPTDYRRLRGSRTESLVGKSFRVTSVKKGERLTVSGDVSFEAGRAELKPQGKRLLDEIADLIRGYPNRVEIVGHACREDNVDDPYQLSWDRARAVLEYIVYKDIKRNRIMAVGAGLTRASDTEGLGDPRRIDITVTEEVVRGP